MSSIVVRNLDPLVKDALTERARERGRSLEAEVRDILTRASQQRRYANLGLAFLAVGKENGGVEELPLSPRADVARAAHPE
ncbi:FitA-like ribbon-helix-helix domain-containing protein [Brachybacterium squillarum]|uniref:FitA-like ribbon-helix-helix domain-containing protein n=1 Tax=Brachybacterium squillarum TaxID=661979 RepID=UPI000493C77F|nr:toxin-antitoxin system [Brachybacterium squillarum]